LADLSIFSWALSWSAALKLKAKAGIFILLTVLSYYMLPVCGSSSATELILLTTEAKAPYFAALLAPCPR
jgi:hypothetical protein